MRGSSPLIVKIPVYVVDALTSAGMADSEAFGEQGGSSVGWFLSEAGSTMLQIAHAAEDRRQRAAAMLTWRKQSEVDHLSD